MCLLLLALGVVPGRPWLLLGNRDEDHARPTAAAAVWSDASDVIGGRDRLAGGTWLALNRNGRFAAVTNVRSGAPRTGERSRGELVAGFVRGVDSALDFAASIARRRDAYGPFNLIVGDRAGAAGASSTRAAAFAFEPGVHVLSNGEPGVEWPKVKRLRAAFMAAWNSGLGPDAFDATLLDALADERAADDAELPDTGVGVDVERRLAPIFIRGERYGTRASTLAYARDDASVVLVERGFGPGGSPLGETRIEA